MVESGYLMLVVPLDKLIENPTWLHIATWHMLLKSLKPMAHSSIVHEAYVSNNPSCDRPSYGKSCPSWRHFAESFGTLELGCSYGLLNGEGSHGLLTGVRVYNDGNHVAVWCASWCVKDSEDDWPRLKLYKQAFVCVLMQTIWHHHVYPYVSIRQDPFMCRRDSKRWLSNSQWRRCVMFSRQFL